MRSGKKSTRREFGEQGDHAWCLTGSNERVDKRRLRNETAVSVSQTRLPVLRIEVVLAAPVAGQDVNQSRGSHSATLCAGATSVFNWCVQRLEVQNDSDNMDLELSTFGIARPRVALPYRLTSDI